MMVKEEILKGNKLIAEFMGLRKIGKLVVDFRLEEDYFSYKISDLKYHSSWDWLMPVVIKMASMRDYDEFRKGYQWPYIEGNPVSCFSISEEYDVNLTLDILWKECVEFIKWYNIQKH